MKLLERIVGENQGTGLLCDPEDEPVAATDCPCRRSDHFAVLDGLFEIMDL